MTLRYPIVYRDGGGPQLAGSLDLTPERLVLEGRAGDERSTISLDLSELLDVSISRAVADRLDNRPVLVLERRGRPPLRVAPLGHGLLHEIAGLVADLSARSRPNDEEVSVVVPLKDGCTRRARDLVAAGPPFDPAALGLARHDVRLSETGLVFVFAGTDVRAKIERVLRSPSLWRAGVAWAECIAGRPYVESAGTNGADAAELLYTWSA